MPLVKVQLGRHPISAGSGKTAASRPALAIPFRLRSPSAFALRAALDAMIPAKQLDRNLLVGTWNLRALGGLTEKWLSEEDDEPIRDLFDVRCIAEIVSRFDVVAIQEVRGNLTALQTPLSALGPNWATIMTDVTRGKAGNNERMAFAFDLRRARPSARGRARRRHRDRDEGLQRALDRQFARTPRAVSFAADRIQLTLVTLHVLYGDETARAAELREIAAWLARWAREERHWNQNLVALGDLNNIDRRGDPLFEAFTSNGDRAGAAAQRGAADDLRRSGGEQVLRTRSPGSSTRRAARCSRSRPRPQEPDFVPLLQRDLRRPRSRGRSPTTTRSGSSSVR